MRLVEVQATVACLDAQGRTASLALNADDADVGDTEHFSLVSADSRLAGGATVSPEGVVTVTPPAGLRSSASLYLRVRVSDSSPGQNGTQDADVAVKIVPSWTMIIDPRHRQG